jgi:thioredoxin reductase (NADPH)
MRATSGYRLLLFLSCFLPLLCAPASAGAGDGDASCLLDMSTDELAAELARRRLEEGADVDEDADEDEDEEVEDFSGRASPVDVEKVVIVGGGPAGLSASLYAARAGLSPLLLAPPAGGQLLGKGVDVENFPGLMQQTGPGVVQLMRTQTRSFGTVFLGMKAASVDLSGGSPFRITLEEKPGMALSGQTIKAQTVIMATGADSKWLGVPGEHDFRGAGVSSCATCDGYLHRGKPLIVIGGGDSAMEDALVLARTASSVTIVHRRAHFRASKVLAQRVLEHPSIRVRWNRQVVRFEGRAAASEDEDPALERVVLASTEPGAGAGGQPQEEEVLEVPAAFVAIGHNPNTGLVQGQLAMDNSTGYITVSGYSSKTSVDGVFAAGDVADPVYRQAITSAGSGAMAALDAERWLSEHAPPPPPPPPPPGKMKKGAAKQFKDCESCVGAGFGWSAKKKKCGPGFPNRACRQEL